MERAFETFLIRWCHFLIHVIALKIISRLGEVSVMLSRELLDKRLNKLSMAVSSIL
jgi:hypothetical protein